MNRGVRATFNQPVERDGLKRLRMISHHAALIYTMVLVSAADRNMTDAELRMMGDLITALPVFHDYSRDLLPSTAASCAELLDSEEGL